MSKKNYEWSIYDLNEFGMCVASGVSATRKDAEREAFHYAHQYSDAGPVELVIYEKTELLRKKIVQLFADAK